MLTQPNTSYVPETKDCTSTEKVTAILILTVIDISAIFCNVLIVATVVFVKNIRQLSEAPLVANLAFSDLIVALMIIPYSIDVLLHDELRFGNGMARFIGFSNFLFCIASIINLTALSVDQFLIIKWPFRFETSRPASSKFTVLYVWIHSACCAIPPYLGISSYSCFIANIGFCTDEQWSGRDDSIIFAVLVIVFSWGISVLMLVFAYANIYHVVRTQKKAIARTMVHQKDCNLLKEPKRSGQDTSVHNASKNILQSRELIDACKILSAAVSFENPTKSNNIEPFWIGQQNQGQETSSSHWDLKRKLSNKKQTPRCSCIPNSKPASSLLIIVLVYLISWTPFCIMLLLEIAIKKKEHHNLSLLFLWIGHSSSLLNPLLYLYRFKKFRKAAICLIRNTFSCKLGVVDPISVTDF